MGNIFAFFVEGILIGLVIVLLMFLVVMRRSINLEKRITRFSISSLTDKQTSFFDNFNKWYERIIKKISKVLSESKILVKYSNKYDKYIDKKYDENIDVISSKILISMLAILLAIISNIIRIHEIGGLSIILAFLIGFYVPDISILINSKIGSFAICTVGRINNIDELIKDCYEKGNIQAVLDGDINDFIMEFLRQKAKKNV